VANLVLCSIALVGSLDDPLEIETCSSVQRGTIIQTPKEKYSAFSWSQCCEPVASSYLLVRIG
jgi:hypothetical protein